MSPIVGLDRWVILQFGRCLLKCLLAISLVCECFLPVQRPPTANPVRPTNTRPTTVTILPAEAGCDLVGHHHSLDQCQPMILVQAGNVKRWTAKLPAPWNFGGYKGSLTPTFPGQRSIFLPYISLHFQQILRLFLHQRL